MLLNIVARLRCRFGRRNGETQVWFWDDADYAVLSRDRCRRLLDEEFLPLFEHAGCNAPQLYGVDHLLALIAISSPELQPMEMMEFVFPLDQLDEAKRRVSDFLLAQTPMSLRKGSQIGFVVCSLSELTLISFDSRRFSPPRLFRSSE